MSNNNDSFLSGLFDFDGDGKMSIGEEYIAYRIFEETTCNDYERIDDDFEDDDIEDTEDA